MKNKFSLKKIICLAIVAIFGISSLVSGVANVAAIPARQLQISPPQQRITLNPGERVHCSYSIQNIGTEAFRYKVRVFPYGVQNENYDDEFDVQSDRTQISNWIKLDHDEGTLAPNKSVEIGYTINVPVDVPAGGQYAAITSEIVPDEKSQSGGAGVANVSRVAHLVFAQVAGDTRTSGMVKENSINTLLLNPPITATAKVENSGNIHSDMVTTLQINELIGNKEVYSNANNPDTRIVLPGTTRSHTLSWDETPGIGLFKVKQTVKFQDKIDTAEKIVVICPFWLIILVTVLIVGIIVWIIMRRRENKAGKNNKTSKEA